MSNANILCGYTNVCNTRTCTSSNVLHTCTSIGSGTSNSAAAKLSLLKTPGESFKVTTQEALQPFSKTSTSFCGIMRSNPKLHPGAKAKWTGRGKGRGAGRTADEQGRRGWGNFAYGQSSSSESTTPAEPSPTFTPVPTSPPSWHAPNHDEPDAHSDFVGAPACEGERGESPEFAGMTGHYMQQAEVIHVPSPTSEGEMPVDGEGINQCAVCHKTVLDRICQFCKVTICTACLPTHIKHWCLEASDCLLYTSDAADE